MSRAFRKCVPIVVDSDMDMRHAIFISIEGVQVAFVILSLHLILF